MAYLLFIAYLAVFILLLRYLAGRGIIRIGWPMAAAGFTLKVLMGCLYGFLFQEYYGGDDTWMYFHQSLEETLFLKSEPGPFLHSLVSPHQYTRYMMTTWWQELEYASLIKLLAILNLFSGGHYYVNVVLFSGITFWGSYFFYRFFSLIIPGREKLAGIVLFFFVPLVFWTSGIRKDGMVWLWSGLFFLSVFRILEQKRWRAIPIALIALLFVALNRNFVALGLLPLTAAWVLSRVMPTWKAYIFVYTTSLVLFFLSHYVGPVDLPQAFVNRQQDFLTLKGGSLVELEPLTPHPAGFLKVLPQALEHVMLRPFPGESTSLLYLASMLESYLVILMMLLAILFPRPGWKMSLGSAGVLAVLAFILSNYLLVGYTIPFLGAIVRYRIIFESLLLVVSVLFVDWEKIPGLKLHKFFL